MRPDIRLESSPNRRHRGVDFRLGESAVVGAEDESIREALLRGGKRRTAVEVEEAGLPQQLAGVALENRLDICGRAALVHDHRQIAFHDREATDRLDVN